MKDILGLSLVETVGLLWAIKARYNRGKVQGQPLPNEQTHNMSSFKRMLGRTSRGVKIY